MIQINSLSLSYSGVIALQDINLTIEKGDVFGLIGQSGAGKSSLIRVLSGLIKPTAGSVLFQGSKKIGMIFQHFNLLSSRTAFENIALPLELAGSFNPKTVDGLLELVGLSHKKNAYASQLSGGEKQRVGIARALAGNPEILFCDEATSALDPKTTKEILDLLRKINQSTGLTIFLITHEMEVVRRICSKVAVMEQGKIVEQGLVSDIFFNPQKPITKAFLQNATHELPDTFFKKASPNRKLLRLAYKGETAGEPIISRLIQNYGIEANILSGWLDNVQGIAIGNLVIELTGEKQKLAEALAYLNTKNIPFEILEK